MRLPDLFGGAAVREGVPLATIDSLLARRGVSSLADQASVERKTLRQAQRFLEELDVHDSPERSAAVGYYKSALTRLNQKPTASEVKAYVQERVLRPEATAHIADPVIMMQLSKTYEELSCEAINALYLLLTSELVPSQHIQNFLLNPELDRIDSSRREILEMISLLYHYGVENYGAAFIPTANDPKFMGQRTRLYSLISEFQYAQWLAARTDATRVQLDQSFRVDWIDLTEADRNFLTTHVDPHLELHVRYRYETHRDTKVDIVVDRPQGQRIVELKNYRRRAMYISGEKAAKVLLQVFRYALAVRRHHLEGMEFVILADEPDRSFIQLLHEALKTTNVPYRLRVLNHRENAVADGLDYPVIERKVSQKRKRPLPALPGSETAFDEAAAKETDLAETPQVPNESPVSSDDAAEPASESPPKISSSLPPERSQQKDASLPWTDAMRAFLDQMIPYFSVKRVPEMRAFVHVARTELRHYHQVQIVENIEAYLSSSHVKEEEAIRSLLNRFMARSANTLTTGRISLLIRIAALVTGDIDNTKEDTSAGLSRELQLLYNSAPSLEKTIEDYTEEVEATLEVTRTLLNEASTIEDLDDLRDEVIFFDPDKSYLSEKWNLRHILAAQRATYGKQVNHHRHTLLWDKKLIKRLDQAIADYDVIIREIEVARHFALQQNISV